MEIHLADNTDRIDENLMAVNLDDDLTSEVSSQPAANEKQFNVSARRRIEEYLESKRLASLTEDYFLAD